MSQWEQLNLRVMLERLEQKVSTLGLSWRDTAKEFRFLADLIDAACEERKKAYDEKLSKK